MRTSAGECFYRHFEVAVAGVRPFPGVVEMLGTLSRADFPLVAHRPSDVVELLLREVLRYLRVTGGSCLAAYRCNRHILPLSRKNAVLILSRLVHQEVAAAGYLPDIDPYHVWANVEFVGADGSINEVDALVLTPSGLYVLELKRAALDVIGGQHVYGLDAHDSGLPSLTELLLAPPHSEHRVDAARARRIVELVRGVKIRPSVADRKVGQLLLHVTPIAAPRSLGATNSWCDQVPVRPPRADCPVTRPAGCVWPPMARLSAWRAVPAMRRPG